jgi:hypothetical protein
MLIVGNILKPLYWREFEPQTYMRCVLLLIAIWIREQRHRWPYFVSQQNKYDISCLIHDVQCHLPLIWVLTIQGCKFTGPILGSALFRCRPSAIPNTLGHKIRCWKSRMALEHSSNILSHSKNSSRFIELGRTMTFYSLCRIRKLYCTPAL